MNNELLQKGIIPAINYHLWGKCNMNCKFCFGQFNHCNQNNLNKKDSIKLVNMLIDFGFEKITFSGGEPTLCPWLHDLLKLAKSKGLITCVVTNGSKINSHWMNVNYKYIDWIALSIDSIDPTCNRKSGRSLPNQTQQDEKYYMQRIKLIQKYNIKLKINTVISRYNLHNDMNDFIKKAKPNRWKLFQALPIKNENLNYKDEFAITLQEFNQFKRRHKSTIPSNKLVSESNYQMTTSYLMVDPNGCFFDNYNGTLNQSKPIILNGIKEAMNQCVYSTKKFIQRGGLYDWE